MKKYKNSENFNIRNLCEKSVINIDNYKCSLTVETHFFLGIQVVQIHGLLEKSFVHKLGNKSSRIYFD